MLTQQEILTQGLLQDWQLSILLSQADVRVVVASRQIGKSLTLRTLCIKEMLENPGISILYLCTTIKQTKAVGFRPMFLEHDTVVPPGVVASVNKTELSATLKNGSRITFAGTENMEALRGLTADIIILDEFQSMPSDVFTTFEPVISARQGKFVIAGTAKGYNHFYDAVQKGLPSSPTFTRGWQSWIVPIDDADVPFKEERIRKAKRTMTAHAFEQEYRCSFHALAGAVYPNFDVSASESSRKLDPGRPLYIGIDFNVGKTHAVVGQRFPITTDDGKQSTEMHIIEEVVLTNTSTQQLADELVRRYKPKWNGRVTLYPDASSSASNMNAGIGVTGLTILKKTGFMIDTPPKNPPIADRVNAVNAMFLNAIGTRRLFINLRCSELIKSLTSQAYDKFGKPEKVHGPDDKSGPVDALGYLIHRLFPINARPVSQYSMG